MIACQIWRSRLWTIDERESGPLSVQRFRDEECVLRSPPEWLESGRSRGWPWSHSPTHRRKRQRRRSPRPRGREYDPGAAAAHAQPRGRLQAVENRHGNVHDEHSGSSLRTSSTASWPSFAVPATSNSSAEQPVRSCLQLHHCPGGPLAPRSLATGGEAELPAEFLSSRELTRIYADKSSELPLRKFILLRATQIERYP